MYLIPRYNLGTPNEYYTAAEILEILKSYFVSRLEKKNYYNKFYILKISKGKNISSNKIF